MVSLLQLDAELNAQLDSSQDCLLSSIGVHAICCSGLQSSQEVVVGLIAKGSSNGALTSTSAVPAYHDC